MLTLFSFYYTNKIVQYYNDKDQIMVSINTYAKEVETNCIEGSISQDGVILGLSGISVNKKKSYSNMKGIGFDEEMIVLERKECIVNKKANLDEYIISGNKYLNAVSILLLVDNIYYLEDILLAAETKNIKLDLVVNLNLLKVKKDLLKEYYDKGYNILYSDNNNLKEYLKELKSIDKNIETFCVYNDYDLIEECSNNKINSIKTNMMFESNILLNAKDNITPGNIMILKCNNDTKSELGLLSNYLTNKGYKILSVTEHLQ